MSVHVHRNRCSRSPKSVFTFAEIPNRLGINAEVPADHGEGSAARTHLRRLGRDHLGDRRRNRLPQLDVERHVRQGSTPLRTGPQPLSPFLSVLYSDYPQCCAGGKARNPPNRNNRQSGTSVPESLGGRRDRDAASRATACRQRRNHTASTTRRRCSGHYSPLPEPAERLLDRLAINTEVARNHGDAIATSTHLRDLSGDRLINGYGDEGTQIDVERIVGQGSTPLRGCPPYSLPVPHWSNVVYGRARKRQRRDTKGIRRKLRCVPKQKGTSRLREEPP